MMNHVPHRAIFVLGAALAGACPSGMLSSRAAEMLPVRTVAEVDIRAAGPSCRMWLGDLTGNGRMDLMMAQPDTGFSTTHRPHSVVAMTAFDLHGNQLWQIGAPDMDNHAGSSADIPAQIHDIDGDGKNEVIACMGEELRVFDGATGALKKSFPLPDPDSHDCILFADFEGSGHARDIVLKDRYRRLWAFDKDWNLRFTFTGTLGHYGWPYDLDGDGREELIIGFHVLNPDGTERWRMDLGDHADALWVADVDGNPDNGMEILVGGEGTYLYRADGTLLWSYEGSVESQNVFPGDFRPDLPGLEIGGLDRINRGDPGLDGLFLLDAQGNELYKEKRTVGGWSSIATVVRNFDGKGGDHFLAYRRGGGLSPGLYDGYMNRVADLPLEGHYMWTDFLGNGVSQLIAYNDDGKALILSATPFDLATDPPGKPRPQPKRLYNWTRYWGSETPPQPATQ